MSLPFQEPNGIHGVLPLYTYLPHYPVGHILKLEDSDDYDDGSVKTTEHPDTAKNLSANKSADSSAKDNADDNAKSGAVADNAEKEIS